MCHLVGYLNHAWTKDHVLPSASDTKHHAHIKQCATSLCCDLYILRQKTARPKILEEMQADVSRKYSAVSYTLLKFEYP